MLAGLRMMALIAWTAFTFLFEGLLEVFTPKAQHPALVETWKMRWVRGARRCFGLRTHVVGVRHPMYPLRGRMILSNHRSVMDVVVLKCLFSGHFLANERTQHAGIVGKAAVKIGTLFVDRSDKKSGAQAVRAMRKLLQEGKTVLVFPEGTTHGGDDVRGLHQGAFVAARGLDVDVVAVGLAYPEGREFTEASLGAYMKRLLSHWRNDVGVAVGPIRAVPNKDEVEAFTATLQALVHDARRALEDAK